MRRATVVFPLPGGPQKIIEPSVGDSSNRVSAPFGPVRCSWPETSARVCGRRRSASGRGGPAAGSAWSMRLMGPPCPACLGPSPALLRFGNGVRHGRAPSKPHEIPLSSDTLPYAPAETVGLIPERLERLTAIISREIEGRAPGASMLIARGGKVAYRQCVGALKPGGPEMSEDAIFRIYSMTKPVVSVAAMTLVEEGRFSISDPVSAFIPAFADAKVGVERDGGKLDLEPLKRPVTVQDLM